MAEHIDSGRLSEQQAADWLIGKGYELVETNSRHGHAGIDFSMKLRGLLIFVEVKYKFGTGFGYAEEFVDSVKK